MPTTAIVSTQILDSGLTGRELVQAADQAAAQAAIGFNPSDYGLIDSDNTWTGFNTFTQTLSGADATFSGDVTTNEVNCAGTFILRPSDRSFIYSNTSPIALFANSAISLYKDVRPTSSITSLGNTTDRWGLIAGIDGDFSGTVSIGAYDTYTNGNGLVFEYSGSSVLEVFSDGRLFTRVSSSTSSLGVASLPWGTVYGIDGSFSGNLNVEDGGSFRFYGLGTEGDTDTQYLEFDTVGNDFELATKETGAGNAGSLYISSDGSANVMFRSDHTRVFQYLRPQTTNTVDFGTDALRFRKSYFVDGDFSGTVTTDTINSATTILLQSNGVTKFQIGDNGINYSLQSLQPDQTGTRSLGASPRRWSDVYSVDGDFSGRILTKRLENEAGYSYIRVGVGTSAPVKVWRNLQPQLDDSFDLGASSFRWSNLHVVNSSISNLTTEVGGSYRIYNLGDDSATDSEHFDISFASNTLTMYTAANGAGVRRNLQFGNADNHLNVKGAANQVVIRTGGIARFVAEDSSVYVTTLFKPSSNGLLGLGTSTSRWSNVYAVNTNLSGNISAVDGNFSGTVTTEYVEGLDGASSAAVWFRDTTYFGYLTSVGQSCLRWGGNDILSFKNLYPQFTTLELGRANGRWLGIFGTNGSFAGNLNSEVGGSYKLYNLGADGDTDTEFLETVVDSGVYCIRTGATGSGTAIKSIYLGTGFAGTNSDRGITVTNSNATFNFGGERLFVSGSEIRSNAKIVPNVDSAYALGEDTKRWSNVASVDGDFSGDLTVSSIVNTGGLDIDLGGILIIRHNTSASYLASSTAFYPNNSKTLGTTTKRWGKFYGSDGSFSGSLTSEVGGSIRHYGLGTEGDADTEYLETSFVFGKPTIQSLSTGSGVARDLTVGTRTGARLEVRPASDQAFLYGSSSIIGVTSSGVSLTGGTVYPAANDATGLGTSSLRWSNVASVNGNFSGDLTAASVIGTSNLTLQSNGGTSKISLANSGGVTITAEGAIYQQFTTAGVSYRVDCLPTFDDNNSLGLTTNRWSDVFATNGSFTGNLVSEVGGSYKLYKLGDASAADQEYLSIRNDIVQTQPSYVIEPIGTGAGTSARQFYIMGSNNRTAGHILLDRFGAVNLKYGNTSNIYVSNGYTRSGANFYPDVDDTHELGLATNRWSDVYSVDGDFTGTVTANAFVGDGSGLTNLPGGGGNPFDQDLNTTDSPSFVDGNFSGTVTTDTINASGSELDLQLGGNTAIKVNSSFSYYYGAAGNTYILQGSDFLRPQGGAAQFDLGGISHRWRTAFVVDGSFTGNLVNEVGGSYKLYNLGAEGDTDTEYLEMSWGTNIASIWNKATGAGTLRELSVGSADNRFRFTASGVICAVNSVTKLNIGSNFTYLGSSVAVLPDTDGTIELGRDAARWQNVASVDGDFSGTVRFGSWEDTGLTGYVETVVPTSDNGQFWIDRNWSGGSSSGRVGIRTDYNASGTAHNHIAVTPTLAEIQLANGLRAVWQTNGNMHRLNMHFRPYVDSTYDNGWTNARWLNYYGVNGSFTGNLVSEVGGSYRLYNLGDESATDQEYLDISSTANVYKIAPLRTGAGAVRQFKIEGCYGANFGNIDFSIYGFLNLSYGSNPAISIRSSGIELLRDMFPNVTRADTLSLGKSTARFGEFYSVDGDFSGTVTTDAIDSTAVTWFKAGGANKFLTSVNGITIYDQIIPSANGTQTIGLTTRRFGSIHGVDGSFSGNLDVEVGGSNRIFNLGSDADVAAGDTEYGGFNWVGNALQIGTYKTGAGTSRSLQFMVGDSTMLYLSSSALTTYTNVSPAGNSTHNLGTNTKYYARTFASATFNALQTITAATDTLVTTDTTNLCDCTSNAIAITIPSGSTAQVGNRYEIKKIDSSANAVTITATGATIDGAASITLPSQYQSVTLVCDGTNWFIV